MVTVNPNDQITVQVQLSGPHLEGSVTRTLRLAPKSKISELSRTVRSLLGKHHLGHRGRRFLILLFFKEIKPQHDVEATLQQENLQLMVTDNESSYDPKANQGLCINV
jgi:hypothetical protein